MVEAKSKTAKPKVKKTPVRKNQVEQIVKLVLQVQDAENVSEPEGKKPTLEDYSAASTMKEKKELDELLAEWKKWEQLSTKDPETKRLVGIIQDVLNPSEEETE